MTREYGYGSKNIPSDFSNWIRALPYPLNSRNYDAQNLDYIWFHYQQGWLITIEEKCMGAMPRRAQQDTHSIVSQLLQLASGSTVHTLRGKRPIIYKGHYLISFENTMPENSEWVRINKRLYHDPERAVIELLTYGNLPPVDFRNGKASQ